MRESFQNCDNSECRKPLPSSPTSWFPPKAKHPLLFCSFGCRRYVIDAAVKPIAGSRNAGEGVKISQAPKPQRKLSQARIKKKLQPSERVISKAIGNTFEHSGVWHTRIQSGSMRTPDGNYIKMARAGTPDRLAAPGVIMFTEVKRAGEKPSDIQAETIEILKGSGALVFVLDSPADSDFLIRELRKLPRAVEAIAGAVAMLQNVLEKKLAEHKCLIKSK